MTTPPQRTPKRPRQGVSALGILFTFPVLLFVTLAIFQFGFVLLVRGVVNAAAVEAAREAANDGRDNTPRGRLQRAARGAERVLAAKRIDRFHLRVQTPETSGEGLETGDSRILCPPPGPAGSREVRVNVAVELVADTVGRSSVPDLLGPFGLSFRGRTLHASAVARVQ